MLRNVTVLLVLGFCASLAQAQAPPRTTEEGRSEVLWLERMCDAANWRPVEECKTSPSDLQCPLGGAAFHMYFGIDHHGGEKAYPIGWPRAHFNPAGWERNWSQWDRFEFMALVKTSRAKLPHTVIGLEVGEGRAPYRPKLEFTEVGKWIKITIPVADVASARDSDPRALTRLRFVVCESNYNDKDVVEFHFGGFRLVRSLECEVAALAAATPVVYAGQPFVKLDATIAGPPAEVKRGVPFTIRTKDQVVRRETLPLGRGKQIYECDISELKLAPGDYQLIVFEQDEAKRKSVSLKVVEDPWKQQ